MRSSSATTAPDSSTGSPPTVDVLAEVVDAVAGRTEVWVDGGIRRGLDIVIARALGARGVLIGRPPYWALAVGGTPGVERALAILREELELALALLGTPTPDDITVAPGGADRVPPVRLRCGLRGSTPESRPGRHPGVIDRIGDRAHDGNIGARPRSRRSR